ncbi:MAG: hypothetical protein LDLANPLL_01128 [Turneriella sp.]|nr:hypothetical protein [Turneriella sp.]
MWLRLLEYISLSRKRLLRIRRIFARKITPPKILIIRNDGLGDFILTLPMVSALKKQLPHARVYVLCARNLHSMSAFLPEIDGWILDPGCLLKRHTKKKRQLQIKTEYTNLVREIAAYRFDLAIFSYAEPKSAKLVRDAGIPYRLGPLRRSFLYRFNLWYFIRRKNTNQSEFQLNLKILRALRLESLFQFPRVKIPPLRMAKIKGRYIVMHPYKRSGTALVWPMENFQALAKYYAEKKTQVVILGDGADEEILQKYFGRIPRVKIMTHLTLVQSAALLKQAAHFFGNSSGPLHLAALVGCPHTAFFPQNKASSQRRWRTLPLDKAPFLSEYLLSTDFPMDTLKCKLAKCKFYPCTAQISVEAAINSANAWKKRRRK